MDKEWRHVYSAVVAGFALEDFAPGIAAIFELADCEVFHDHTHREAAGASGQASTRNKVLEGVCMHVCVRRGLDCEHRGGGSSQTEYANPVHMHLPALHFSGAVKQLRDMFTQRVPNRMGQASICTSNAVSCCCK